MDEKVDIFMPLYIGDYAADTTDLTTEEHGAYLLILMAMWRAREPLPLHRLRPTAKVSATRWPAVWEVIGRFFTIAGDLVTQQRLFRTLGQSLEKKRRASDRGASGARGRWNKDKPDGAQAMAQASSEHASSIAKGEPGSWPARLKVDVLTGESQSGSGSDPDPSRSNSTLDRRALASPPYKSRPTVHLGAATPDFMRVYKRYPNPHRMQQAAQVFQDLAERWEGGETALADEIETAFDDGFLNRHPYSSDQRHRPKLEDVLAELRWQEPAPAPDPVEAAKPAETLAQRDERARREGLERRIAAKAELEAKERAVTAAIAARAAGGAP